MSEPRTRERGFALPLVLLSLVVLSALATGGLLLARSELEVSRSHRAAVRALYVADRGLERYLAEHVRIVGPRTYGEGTDEVAEISVEPLVELDGRPIPDAGSPPVPPPRLWRVASRGRYEAPDGRTAAREVSAAVLDDRLRLDTDSLGALVLALNGLEVRKQEGGFVDGDGRTACDGRSVAAIAVPSDRPYAETAPADVRGSVSPRIDRTRTSAEWLALVDGLVPWRELAYGELLDPDHVITADGAWPTAVAPGVPPPAGPGPAGPSPPAGPVPPAERVYRIAADEHDAGGAGGRFRGVLIATGDLTITDARVWEGVMLVGGRLRADAAGAERPVLAGTVVTGLNTLLCRDPAEERPCPESGVRRVEDVSVLGAVEVGYDPCAVDAAVHRLAERTENLVRHPGTWREEY